MSHPYRFIVGSLLIAAGIAVAGLIAWFQHTFTTAEVILALGLVGAGLLVVDLDDLMKVLPQLRGLIGKGGTDGVSP